MSTLEFLLPEGSPDPCPMACGGFTEDAAGGPCKACWDKVPGPYAHDLGDASAYVCDGCGDQADVWVEDRPLCKREPEACGPECPKEGA